MMLRKVWAFFVRDFLEELSYPLSIFWRGGSILFHLVTFYYLGRLVAPAASPVLAPYGGNYFPFVMVGLALASFQGVALSAIARNISYGMYSGTLEAMLVTPTAISTIVFASVLYQFFIALLEILVYIGFSTVFFGLSLARADFLAGAVILVLTLLSHLPLGILSAAFLLAFKRGDPVTMMMGRVSALLGGVYFPLQVLPGWLQTLSWCIPFTHALEGLRQAVLNGKSLGQLGPQVAVLSAFAAVLLPLSLAAFAWAVRQAKRLGTLSQY
jgi:ABC-2 type transport system permease protein